MRVKFCPLLMQGIASSANDYARAADRRTITNPTMVSCIGSTCAAWTTSMRSGEVVLDGWGRCAHFGGDSYPDPAGGTQ